MDLHDLLEDAIYYAGQDAWNRDRNTNEYMSLVYETPEGKFGYTQPQGGEHSGKVKAKIRYPRNALPRATVHNHPPKEGYDGDEQHFSPEDIEQAKALKLLSAIVYGNNMQMSTFQHDKDSTRRDGGLKISKGRLFNHIPEVKPAGVRLAELKKEGGL